MFVDQMKSDLKRSGDRLLIVVLDLFAPVFHKLVQSYHSERCSSTRFCYESLANIIADAKQIPMSPICSSFLTVLRTRIAASKLTSN